MLIKKIIKWRLLIFLTESTTHSLNKTCAICKKKLALKPVSTKQCCGTETIFSVPVPFPVPTFVKIRFRL
jgi:hypothetical protein